MGAKLSIGGDMVKGVWLSRYVGRWLGGGGVVRCVCGVREYWVRCRGCGGGFRVMGFDQGIRRLLRGLGEVLIGLGIGAGCVVGADMEDGSVADPK